MRLSKTSNLETFNKSLLLHFFSQKNKKWKNFENQAQMKSMCSLCLK